VARASRCRDGAPARSTAARGFQFSVIGHPLQHGRDEAALKRAIAEASQADSAFVVATGIKAATSLAATSSTPSATRCSMNPRSR
jgi:hypothetical protein